MKTISVKLCGRWPEEKIEELRARLLLFYPNLEAREFSTVMHRASVTDDLADSLFWAVRGLLIDMVRKQNVARSAVFIEHKKYENSDDLSDFFEVEQHSHIFGGYEPTVFNVLTENIATDPGIIIEPFEDPTDLFPFAT